MNYFITNAPLTMMEEGGRINWTGWGFDIQEITLAVSGGFQQQDGERTVSILPITDEKLLKEKLGKRTNSTDSLGFYKISPESEAVEMRNRLKATNDADAEKRKNTPTHEDIYKAQQIKLLTEIKMKLGGTANV